MGNIFENMSNVCGKFRGSWGDSRGNQHLKATKVQLSKFTNQKQALKIKKITNIKTSKVTKSTDPAKTSNIKTQNIKHQQIKHSKIKHQTISHQIIKQQ